MDRRIAPRVASLSLMAATIAACSTTIPDMSPFADQTAKMSSGVKNGFTEAQTLLAQTEIDSSLIDSLTQAWEQTSRTLNAMVGYSNALAEVARAGQSGAEATTKVTDALSGLASTLGVGAVSAPVSAALSAAGDYITRARAHKKLKDAVSTAQPAIDTIAWIIDQNLGELGTLNTHVGQDLKLAVDAKYQRTVNYYELLVREDTAIVGTLTIMLEYRAALDSAAKLEVVGAGSDDIDFQRRVANARLDDARVRDPTLNTENFNERQKFWMGRSQALRNEANRYLPDYEAYVTLRDEIRVRTITGSAILQKSQEAVRAWAGAHGQLGESLRNESKFVNLVGFASAVQDVVDAYRGS